MCDHLNAFETKEQHIIIIGAGIFECNLNIKDYLEMITDNCKVHFWFVRQGHEIVLLDLIIFVNNRNEEDHYFSNNKFISESMNDFNNVTNSEGRIEQEAYYEKYNEYGLEQDVPNICHNTDNTLFRSEIFKGINPINADAIDRGNDKSVIQHQHVEHWLAIKRQ